MKTNPLFKKEANSLDNVNDVFKKLNDEFGGDLFNIVRKAPDMTEEEATKVMEDFSKKVGDSFERDCKE